jgi:hypothetical protein
MGHPMTPMPMNPYVTFGKAEVPSVVAIVNDVIEALQETPKILPIG